MSRADRAASVKREMRKASFASGIAGFVLRNLAPRQRKLKASEYNCDGASHFGAGMCEIARSDHGSRLCAVTKSCSGGIHYQASAERYKPVTEHVSKTLSYCWIVKRRTTMLRLRSSITRRRNHVYYESSATKLGFGRP